MGGAGILLVALGLIVARVICIRRKPTQRHVNKSKRFVNNILCSHT